MNTAIRITQVVTTLAWIACTSCLIQAQEVGTASAPGQKTTFLGELKRMEQRLKLTENQVEAIKAAVEPVYELEREDAEKNVRFGFKPIVGPNTVKALFSEAEKIADKASLKNYLDDYAKLGELESAYARTDMIFYLDHEFSLTRSQMEQLETILESKWSYDCEEMLGRLRFDGFPGTEEFMSEIELKNLLSETQYQLYELRKDINTQINHWPSLGERENWEPDLLNRLEICFQLEAQHYGELSLDDTQKTKIRTVKKRIFRDIVDGRENAIKNYARLFEGGHLKYLFSTELNLIKDHKLWQSVENLLVESSQVDLDPLRTKREQNKKTARVHSLISNVFSQVRADFFEVKLVEEQIKELYEQHNIALNFSLIEERLIEIRLDEKVSEDCWKSLSDSLEKLKVYDKDPNSEDEDEDEPLRSPG